jgi:hypothetical protein
MIEEPALGALHDLIAVPEIGSHPTADVPKPVRRETSALAKSLVDWPRIAIAKCSMIM